MATKLVAYKAGSESAKALAEKLGIKRLKEEGSIWRGKAGDNIINWGRSAAHNAFGGAAKVLNTPEAIANASNKIRSFQRFARAAENPDINLPIPMHTTNRATALQWLRDGSDVVIREVVQGHSGQGINIIKAADARQYVHGDVPFPGAPLYTVYIRKTQEYRIHVMNNEAFFVQRKARKLDVPNENVNWQVRNLDGGFIYANVDVEVDEVAKQIACNAVNALGLDFGAVDILQTKTGKFYVLEVNTACGLAGTTLDKYAEAFQKNYGI